MPHKGKPVTSLKGLSALIVEDESMVAMLLEELLVEFGCHPVFIASRVDMALARLEETRFDVAVLDVNLDGEASYPVADELNRRNLPFLFATGYGSQAIPESYHRHIVLQKPFRKQQFEAALLMALRDGRQA